MNLERRTSRRFAVGKFAAGVAGAFAAQQTTEVEAVPLTTDEQKGLRHIAKQIPEPPEGYISRLNLRATIDNHGGGEIIAYMIKNGPALVSLTNTQELAAGVPVQISESIDSVETT